MQIELPADLEAALKSAAQKEGLTPENLAIKALRDRFLPRVYDLTPRDEWERQLLSIGIDCGVSLSNEALSSEGLYD